MKSLLLLFFLLVISPQSWGLEEPHRAGLLSKKDVFQAEQWIGFARSLWGAGDYPMVDYYCRMIVFYYPETRYAREAEKYLGKMEKPSANRRREFIRNNPGLLPLP